MKWFLMLASMKYIATQQLPAVWSFCVMVLSHLPWFRGQLPQQRNNGHVMLTSVNYQLTVTNTRQLNKKNNPKLFPPKLPCCGRSKVKRIAGDQVLPCRKVNEFQHFIFIQITLNVEHFHKVHPQDINIYSPPPKSSNDSYTHYLHTFIGVILYFHIVLNTTRIYTHLNSYKSLITPDDLICMNSIIWPKITHYGPPAVLPHSRSTV